MISREVIRQIDKSNNNAIGYFHQNLFKYIKYCEVPNSGFDVIFNKDNCTIYVELKNKHNTTNSDSGKSIYRRF